MTRESERLLEDAPLRAFHARLTLYSAGGPFCDGYILGIIAIALTPLAAALRLSLTWEGLIGSASLIGVFVGGVAFGYVTDRVGRRFMYTLDLALFVLASAAQLWVASAWTLLALRLVLGIAVGADYPIVSALVAELAPRQRRGMLLSIMVGAWWVGYACSFLAGYALTLYAGPATWRWILASSALPAALIGLLRQGTPESPQWLVTQGRYSEAEAVVHRYFGAQYRVDAPPACPTVYSRIFSGDYLWRTGFVCLFWVCQIIPTFGIYTFTPDLLGALGVPNPLLGSVVISSCFLLGVIPAIVLIDRIGRRVLLILPFAVTGLCLLALAVVPRSATTLVAVAFAIFAIFNAGGSVLQWVYPSELFPTEVRATAVGFATAASRVGAAVGTFFVPMALHRFGVRALMLAFAGICLLGWVVAMRFAPETRGLSLHAASGKLKLR
jgi:putative MFS transporter